jgi:hypothetical protein
MRNSLRAFNRFALAGTGFSSNHRIARAIPFFDAIVFAIPETSTWLTGTLSLGVIVFV